MLATIVAVSPHPKELFMKRVRVALTLLAAVACCGCTMFTAWKSIPPPGGCDQCHTLPISTNWQVAYKAPNLRDERDRNYFQTEKYSMPANETQPASALEKRKVEEQRCFECHRAPSTAHKERMGRFHH
jgi:hypothetical protein